MQYVVTTQEKLTCDLQIFQLVLEKAPFLILYNQIRTTPNILCCVFRSHSKESDPSFLNECECLCQNMILN